MTHPTGAERPMIHYEEGDLAYLAKAPRHYDCGIYLICVQGQATVTTGIQQYRLQVQTELIFLTGSLLQLLEATPDFRVRLVTFGRDVYLKAILPIDTPYFAYAHEHPCYLHTADERSQKTWREIVLWMDVARMLFSDGKAQFRSRQEHNYLQSLLMWLFNTIPEKIEVTRPYSRKQALCHQFNRLVREYGASQHQVSFYADRLCITPRYLYEITMEYQNGKTPKQLIDEQLLAEVKVQLNDPSRSVTEIAEQLGFADQSYLTRFFKKSTGMSPRQFRAKNR